MLKTLIIFGRDLDRGLKEGRNEGRKARPDPHAFCYGY